MMVSTLLLMTTASGIIILKIIINSDFLYKAHTTDVLADGLIYVSIIMKKLDLIFIIFLKGPGYLVPNITCF